MRLGILALTALLMARGATTVPSGTLITTAASPIPAGQSPWAIATGDFNGDGKLDMAVANQPGSLTILLGDGAGGFRINGTLTVGFDSYSVAPGDFNGDHVLDLAVTTYTTNQVWVFLGDGHGGFQAAPGSPIKLSLTGSLQPIALADFNRDGKLDIIVGNINGNTAYLLLGNGAGGFTQAANNPITVGYGPISFTTGDFNGDGNPDLAVANYYGGPYPPTPGGFPPAGNTVTVLLGNGSGGFTAAPGSPFVVGGSPESIVAGDFNGDGKTDLAVVAISNFTTYSGILAVLLGNGLGGFSPAPGGPLSLAGINLQLTAADLNGDGVLDLAVAFAPAPGNGPTARISAYLGNGFGGFASVGLFPVGATAAAIASADFNGDGRADLATADVTGGITVLLGAPASTSTLLSSTTPATIVDKQSILLFAQVSDTGTAFAPPTGSVTFLEGTTRLATVALSGGSAAFTITNVTGTSHTYTAVYGGDARSSASTSNALSFAPTPITIGGVANGASFQPGVAAPNTILSLFGSNLACTPQPQVLVNGTVAEVLAATAGQINFVAPPNFSSGTLSLQVVCGLNQSQPYPISAGAAAPAVFTALASGSGQASVLNQDGSVNGPTAPAARGDYISIYGTGFGAYAPPDANGLQQTIQPVTVFFGDVPGTVQFAGHAPGYTLGLQQINVQIPATAPAGSAVSIRLAAGNASTQQTITVAVQ